MKKIILIFVVLSIIGVGMIITLYSPPVKKADNKKIMSTFNGIYEASGVEQLSDGRAIVIEDEKLSAIKNILTFKSKTKVLVNQLKVNDDKIILNDLEGITIDADDKLFAITSHSQSIKGKNNSHRSLLVRFSVINNTISDYKEVSIKDSLYQFVSRRMGINAINIEGLSFNEKKNKLLIGLRDPVVKGKSLILTLENPQAIFDEPAEEPEFSNQIIQLDLDGGGIRSLYYDHKIGGYLIVNEVKNRRGQLRSKIWLWSGESEDEAHMLIIPGMENIKNIEGITSIKILGKDRILIVADDGIKSALKGAHFAIIKYSNLIIK